MIQETWHPTCQKKKYFSITSFSLNAFYFLLSSLVFPIHGEAVVTIRLTELEPVKPASRAMPVEVQDSAAGLLIESSANRVSNQSLAGEQHSTHPYHRIVFYLIGSLLVATALAKSWMLLTDSFADVRVGIPKEILWLSVAVELGLAWQNFRLRDHRVLALINTVVFASFGIFAAIRWMLGSGSCGCAGSLPLPAWLFVLIDGLIVVWFTITSDQRTRFGQGFYKLVQNWNSCSPEKRGRFVGLGLSVSLIFAIQLSVASPLRAMVLGEPLLVARVRIDGDLRLNQSCDGIVTLENRSSWPAKIMGLAQSCRCFDLMDDPVSKIVPAYDRISLPLVIKPNKLGPLRQRVELFLDHPKQFRVKADVVSFVKE
jgi:hypothetical protein